MYNYHNRDRSSSRKKKNKKKSNNYKNTSYSYNAYSLLSSSESFCCPQDIFLIVSQVFGEGYYFSVTDL